MSKLTNRCLIAIISDLFVDSGAAQDHARPRPPPRPRCHPLPGPRPRRARLRVSTTRRPSSGSRARAQVKIDPRAIRPAYLEALKQAPRRRRTPHPRLRLRSPTRQHPRLARPPPSRHSSPNATPRSSEASTHELPPPHARGGRARRHRAPHHHPSAHPSSRQARPLGRDEVPARSVQTAPPAPHPRADPAPGHPLPARRVHRARARSTPRGQQRRRRARRGRTPHLAHPHHR
jgi:hypothetical protein